MLVVWLFAGGLVGLLSAVSLRWTVARLHPGASWRAVILTAGGALLRWCLAAGLLIAALQRGIAPTLLAFAGLWLTRWSTVWWFNRE